jgi:hypothetical protein
MPGDEGGIAERNLTRADAIGAWVCGMGVAAAVLLVLVYAVKT